MSKDSIDQLYADDSCAASPAHHFRDEGLLPIPASTSCGSPPRAEFLALIRFGCFDNAPPIAYDSVIGGSITAPYGVALYRVPTVPSLRLYVDHWTAYNSSASCVLYDSLNASVGGNYLGVDAELTPTLSGQHVLALVSTVADPVPFVFQIVPGNHAPVTASIAYVFCLSVGRP